MWFNNVKYDKDGVISKDVNNTELSDEYVDVKEDNTGSKLWLVIVLDSIEVPVSIKSRDGVSFDKDENTSWCLLSKPESFPKELGNEAARCRPVRENYVIDGYIVQKHFKIENNKIWIETSWSIL